ncbi:MAG: DUF2279 domain-containing protein, partial [Sphingobacteriales bacterium]
MEPAVKHIPAFVVSLPCTASIKSARNRFSLVKSAIVLLLNIFIILFFSPATAQDSLHLNHLEGIKKDNPVINGKLNHNIQPFNGITDREKKRRIKIIAAANIAGYSAATIGIYHAWYKNYPQSKFHTFNDIGEWQQMDKIGHVYSAYAASKASMELWRWTGIDRKKQIWIGGMSGFLYQTTIEVMDGFSKEWGWSWGDFGANVVGSGLMIAQELAWDRQRIQMKWSFHRKKYSDAMLNA